MRNEAEGAAPGRLDFLGGVADYSGSWVLEAPIPQQTRVSIRGHDRWEFCSHQQGNFCLETRLWRELCSLPRESAPAIRQAFLSAGVPNWVRYPLGCFLALVQDQMVAELGDLAFAIEINSEVPLGMGVSSSAAIEVATLRALTELLDLKWSKVELARTAQRVENELVGAPCGLMDQLTASCGKPRYLLPILCRPDEVRDPVKLPEDINIVGWPSGVKHEVGASPYVVARAAAFMGKKIVEANLNRRLPYLSEVSVSEFRKVSTSIPERMSAGDFLARFGDHDDPLTALPGRDGQSSESLCVSYPVRGAARFPIEESNRVRLALILLDNLARTAGTQRWDCVELIGELLLQSHQGYTDMGLGCQETDAMVEAVMELGPKKGIFGARVSGGGRGGTVVVLMRPESLPLLVDLKEKLRTKGPLLAVR